MLVLWEDGNEVKQWLSKEILAPCREPNLRMEQFRFWHVGEHEGVTQPDMLRPFVVGIERQSLQEQAAVVYATKSYLAGVEHFYLFGSYYDAGANDDEQLADSILAGYRNHIGYGVTEHADDGFSLKALAHDSWVPPSPRLEKNSIALLPFAKTARTFSPVMDWAMSLALAGRLHFADDDEILASHLLGIHAKRDLNNNAFPRRANQEKPIDAAIAALYALRLAMAPNFLKTPEVSDVKCIFLMEDGSVSESSPNGLVQTHAPLEQKPQGAVNRMKKEGCMKFCSEFGCPDVALTGDFCEKHSEATARKTQNAPRHAQDKWYGLAAWKGPYGVRAYKLKRNPQCEICGAAAQDVHHLRPWKDAADLVRFHGWD